MLYTSPALSITQYGVLALTPIPPMAMLPVFPSNACMSTRFAGVPMETRGTGLPDVVTIVLPALFG